MIFEIAQITIDPARACDFIAAVEQARPAFAAAQGFRGMTLEQQVEDPACFYLRVSWDSIEDHMVTFRASDGFQNWRALAGPFFVAPPVVVHSGEVGDFG